MTNMRSHWLSVALAAVLVVACGKSSSSSAPLDTAAAGDLADQNVPPPIDTVAPVEPTPTEAAIRIRGVNGPTFDLVLLDVARVVVRCDDEELEVRDGEATVDLSRSDHAFLLGRFTLPDADCRIRVGVALKPCGFISFGNSDATITLDATGIPLHFSFPIEYLEARRHAVINLDLSKSIVPIDPPVAREGAVLLPSFDIGY